MGGTPPSRQIHGSGRLHIRQPRTHPHFPAILFFLPNLFQIPKTALQETHLFQYQLTTSYREIQIINTILPRHPNIIPPPEAFVVIKLAAYNSNKHLICGSIYPIYENGLLAAALNKSRKRKK